MGVSGSLLYVVVQFFLTREHFFVVEDSHYVLMDVYSGVPKGSVLGPICFSLHC